MNTSSWIATIDYVAGSLFVTKHDGGLMIFREVPSWVPGLLAAAKSPGRAAIAG